MRFPIALLVAVVPACGVCRGAYPEDISELIADLKSNQLPVQIRACDDLAALGNRAAEALPRLVEVLRSGPMEARQAAMWAVAAIGPEATTAVPPLILLLRDRRYWVRDEAASALIAIGPAALPLVLRAMKSDSARVRAAAARAASEISHDDDHVFSALSDALNDPDARVRATAAVALGRCGGKAVPVLAAASGEKDACAAVAIAEALNGLHAGSATAVAALERLLDEPQARLAAVRGLQQYGVEARHAIPALIQTSPGRIENDEALRHIGPPRIDDLPAIEKLLHDRSPEVRTLAARELGLMGDYGATCNEAVAALRPSLADGEATVRMEAARSLWRLTHEPTTLLPVLEGAADPEQYDAIRGVSETLQEIGKPAVPTLIRLLRSESERVRWWAAEGLGGIAPDAADALPSLVVALSDADPDVPDAASRAIGRFGPAAAPAVLDLTKVTNDGRLTASQLAVAVVNIGPKAKETMPLLIAGLATGDESARSRIVGAICAVGAEDEATVDVVLGVINNGRVRRAWAIDGFAHLKGPAAKKAIPILQEALQEGDDYMRQVAAETLGQMGSSANAALPQLQDAAGDKRFNVRLQAALSLWRLTGETGPMKAAVISAFREKIAENDYNTAYRRREAVQAVREMGESAAPLIPALTSAMKGSDDNMQIELAGVLCNIGRPARAAVPALTEMAKETDWPVRKAALDALKRLRK